MGRRRRAVDRRHPDRGRGRRPIRATTGVDLRAPLVRAHRHRDRVRLDLRRGARPALQGVGFAALTPIIITSLGDLYAGTKEATAQGLRFTGSGLSQTAFPLAAGVLVGMAWQYPFLLYAISFPIAAVVYAYFEEPLDKTADGNGEAGLRTQVGDMRALVAQRRAWTMVVARGSANVAWFGFLTYNSILVVDVLGGTPAEAGVLAALASLTYALAATQAGRIADVFDDRLYPLVAMNLSMGVGLALVFLARSLAVAAVGVVFMGAGFGLVLSIYRSVITTLPPADLRGGLVSLGEGSGRERRARGRRPSRGSSPRAGRAGRRRRRRSAPPASPRART
ncbi:hypothetical protein DJ71_26225 [Halorubrum sp. E3]|nr:hypothetical protein DJ71_26225 [Halorubrum sp. E3]